MNSPDLLKLLAGNSRVAPALGRATSLTPGALGQSSFAKLLDQAKAGQVDSGLSVGIADGADVELTPEQLKRLSAAADQAEAAGATRVLVKIDDQWIKLDVAARRVTGKASGLAGSVETGIDGVMEVPATDQHAAEPHGTGHALIGVHPAIARLLEGRRGAA